MVHGIFSSGTRTSLRHTEKYYKLRGYDVKYIEYNSILENPVDEIHYLAKPGDIVIGHSLGGKYVSEASKTGSRDIAYYTVNSPYSTVNDNATDLKHRYDWSNVLLFFSNPFSLFDSHNKWSPGGHSVGDEQVV